MRKFFLITFLFISVFAQAQKTGDKTTNVTARDTLKADTEFVYRDTIIPMLDVTYHEFSVDSITWSKEGAGANWIRFSNKNKNEWDVYSLLEKDLEALDSISEHLIRIEQNELDIQENTDSIIEIRADLNELNDISPQILSISNDTIYLTDGGFVVLDSGSGSSGWNYDVQNLSGSTDTLDVDDGLTSIVTLTSDMTIRVENLEAGMWGRIKVNNSSTTYTIQVINVGTAIPTEPLIYTGDVITMSGGSHTDILFWTYDGVDFILNGYYEVK
jgi:hypothetical protein